MKVISGNLREAPEFGAKANDNKLAIDTFFFKIEYASPGLKWYNV
jgi:hypothetical protein